MKIDLSADDAVEYQSFMCCRSGKARWKTKKKDMITAIKLGLVDFVLFALAYAVETRAILALESSDSGPQVYEYAP